MRRSPVFLTLVVVTVATLAGLRLHAMGQRPAEVPVTSLPFGSLLDFSFTGSHHGWALGYYCTATNNCAGVALRATGDGGRTWHAIPLPRGMHWEGARNDRAGVSMIRFSSLSDGWMYGPGLWSTHDGGSSWRMVSPSAPVLDLAAQQGSVWVIEGTCPGDVAKPCRYTMQTSDTHEDRWSRLRPLPFATGYGAHIARAGSTIGWLMNSSSLFKTVTGGRTWQQLPSPCGWLGPYNQIVALDARYLYMVRGDQGATDMQEKCFAASSDGGRHWKVYGACFPPSKGCAEKGGPGWIGFVGNLAVTGPRTAWLSQYRAGLIETTDGGQIWRVAIPRQTISPEADAGPVRFVDRLHGWIAAGTMFYRTIDGGKHWSPSEIK